MKQDDNTDILIVLIAGIGDVVLASPAMRAVRNAHPESRLHLVTSREAAPVAKNYPWLDRVWEFPIRQFRSRKSVAAEMLSVIKALREIRFEAAINLYRVCTIPGALKMGLLFLPLRARVKAGHDNMGFGLFVNTKIPRDNFTGRHFSESMLAAASFVGAEPDDVGLEVFCSKAAEDKWQSFFDEHSDRKLIGINAGGDRLNRRWAPEKYAAVADELASSYDADILLLGGPSEKEIAAGIRKMMKAEACDLSGTMTVDELVCLIKRLDLLVTNDSGPMHIAAAARTRVVAVFGPEDPAVFGPAGNKDRCAVVCKKDLDCRPCSAEECKHVSCLTQITSEEVVAAAARLMEHD